MQEIEEEFLVIGLAHAIHGIGTDIRIRAGWTEKFEGIVDINFIPLRKELNDLLDFVGVIPRGGFDEFS